MKISKASLALAVIQVLLVLTIAGKYWHERKTCPRVWTKTAMYDPELVMRGRYLSLRLTVDGCASTLPSAKQARFPRNQDGVPQGSTYAVLVPDFVQFEATLAVKNNKLIAVRIPDGQDVPAGQQVFAPKGSTCETMSLAMPVNFYIAEHAANPLPVKPGQELWVEVTVPPKGPPRPLQLALKEANGTWRPLAFN